MYIIKIKMAEEIKKTAIEITEENLEKLLQVVLKMNELYFEYESSLKDDDGNPRTELFTPELVMSRIELRKQFNKITDYGIKNPDIYLAMNKPPKGWNECAKYILYKLDKAPKWVWNNFRLKKKFNKLLKEYSDCYSQFENMVDKTTREYQMEKKTRSKFEERNLKPEKPRDYNYFKFGITLIMDPEYLRDLAWMHECHPDISDMSPKEIKAMKIARFKNLEKLSEEDRQRYYDYCDYMRGNRHNRSIDKDDSSKVIYHSAYVTNDSLRNRELSKSDSELDEDEEFEALLHISFKRRRAYEKLLSAFE